MPACANHLASLGIVSPTELAAMVFYNPLKLIGVRPEQVRIGKKGPSIKSRHCGVAED